MEVRYCQWNVAYSVKPRVIWFTDISLCLPGKGRGVNVYACMWLGHAGDEKAWLALCLMNVNQIT